MLEERERSHQKQLYLMNEYHQAAARPRATSSTGARAGTPVPAAAHARGASGMAFGGIGGLRQADMQRLEAKISQLLQPDKRLGNVRRSFLGGRATSPPPPPRMRRP